MRGMSTRNVAATVCAALATACYVADWAVRLRRRHESKRRVGTPAEGWPSGSIASVFAKRQTFLVALRADELESRIRSAEQEQARESWVDRLVAPAGIIFGFAATIVSLS